MSKYFNFVIGRAQQTYFLKQLRRSYSTQTEHIQIPNRIPRRPTDILRALESTISRDPTAAHYKYHDDPFLIPKSNIGKRSFAMAQEAGRKAAHWVRKEHADLFQHRECDPPIEAFFPRVTYNQQSEVTENDLVNVIENVQVSDAILIYNLLNEQKIQISEKVEQALLELVCYNNSEDPLNEEFIEERWFRQSNNPRERHRKTWKDGSFAEELFITIENPSAEAYSALIQGMCKHYQVDRAWQLFEEANQKGHVLDVEVYNSIIRVASFLKEAYEMRWSLVGDLLGQMNQAEIKPNLSTLNSVLFTISTMGGSRASKDFTLKTLREFKEIGIEPSLGSWYFVLITFCKERGPISTILHDIMALIENTSYNIQHISDTSFFVTAIDICHNHLNDVELAKRVDNLLHHGNNYSLIGDSYKESIYYRHYFSLLVRNMHLDDFMENVYNNLVPNIYVPEPSVMAELLNQLEVNAAVEYLPGLWSDMKIFDHVQRENLINLVLDIGINSVIPADSSLNERLSVIAWDVYELINSQSENRVTKLSFTGDLLGKIMTLVLRNNDFDNATKIMNKLDKGHNTIVGVPKFEALSLYIDSCILNKTPSTAITCIQYCNDSGFPEASSLASRLNEKLTLDEKHIKQLTSIFGDLKLAN